MRRRSMHVKTSRQLSDDRSPYSIYQSIYGPQNDEDVDYDRGYYAKHLKRGNARPVVSNIRQDTNAYHNQRQPHKISIPRVDVEDLRVKLPQSSTVRWVEVDKCNFSTENSTLDTRLIFPDLTISGKVIMQPTGGKCSMILRLRRAGIEFRTTPIGFENYGNEESRRLGSASVRTDSHFAEPGFISVFAHDCQLTTGNSFRRNSKRRFGFVNPATNDHRQHLTAAANVHLSEPEIYLGGEKFHRWGKYYDQYKPDYDIRTEGIRKYGNLRGYAVGSSNMESVDSPEFIDPNADNFYRRQLRHRRSAQNEPILNYKNDQMSFNDDILNVGEDFQQLVEPDARAFANIFDSDSMGEDVAESKDMENLFSMGVRGLLTTYMQRALQPAIKETLMENMGYTLSYG